MRNVKLNIPLTEKSRPSTFTDIIGQGNGILALKAALCGSNPQHVIIYGPPGIGKTAAARLVLEEAKKNKKSPFRKDAKFIEIDATTLKFDERGIADPLIGSVHDPIYQGAGIFGIAGIPKPKPGAVTKAHGGILFIDETGEKLISDFCSNGREAVSLIQLCSGIATNKNKDFISNEDINWVIENCQYTKRIEDKIGTFPEIGVVNGLAVYGANMGMTMKIEVAVKKSGNKKGDLKVSGIVEEEIISSNNKKFKRKSTAISSVENVLTVLNNMYNLECDKYHIHINIPGGVPVDGPSAGIAIATALYSAIKGKEISNTLAITGELGLLGCIKPVGGILAKILGAKKAGVKKVIIPRDNWVANLSAVEGIEICLVGNIDEVFKMIFPIIKQKETKVLSASF